MFSIETTAHFINIGGFTSLYRDCYQEFISKHPTWKTVLWTVKDVDRLVKERGEDKYFYSLNTFINRYNFAKYLILAVYGGWYVDLDVTWRRTLDDLIKTKLAYRRSIPLEKRIKEPYPKLFVPVRSFPRQKEVNHKMNDDNILYAEKGVLFDLITFARNRKDVDTSKEYEPFGPISLSMWLHSRDDLPRKYMYEDEIQKYGSYCRHLNSTGWKIS